jgi:hypothetical protein
MPSRKTKQNQRVPPRTRKMKGGHVPRIISADVINNPNALAKIISNLGKTNTFGITGRLTGAKIEEDLQKLEKMANKLDKDSKIKLYTAIAFSMYSKGPIAMPEKGESPSGFAADSLGNSAGYKYFVDKTCLPFLREQVKTPSKSTPTPVAKLTSTRRRILKTTTRYPASNNKQKPDTEFSFAKISKIMDKTVNETMPVATEEALSGVDFDTLSDYLNALEFTKDDKTNISNRINLFYSHYPLGKDPRGHYMQYKYNLLSNGKEIIIIAEDPKGDKYSLTTFARILLTPDANGMFMVYSLSDGILMAYRCSLEQPQLPATNREGLPLTAENQTTQADTINNTLMNRRSKSNSTGAKLLKEQRQNMAAYHSAKFFADIPNGAPDQGLKATHNRHTNWSETTSKCTAYETPNDCENDTTCDYNKETNKCVTKKE